MGTGDNDTRAVHDALKAKALTLTWLKTFFDGDADTNPKEFDGLNMRLTGDQVITAGANGAALTMDMLDDIVDAVRGTPSVLLMNTAQRRAWHGRASLRTRVCIDGELAVVGVLFKNKTKHYKSN